MLSMGVKTSAKRRLGRERHRSRSRPLSSAMAGITLTRLGLGSRFGSGQQAWPWVALRDEAAAIRHLLTSDLDGVVNIAGPTPATSRQVTDALAEALGRWHPWVVPEFAVNLLGDAGHDLLLSSQNVVPQRLLDDGFVFRYETVQAAIGEIAREQ